MSNRSSERGSEKDVDVRLQWIRSVSLVQKFTRFSFSLSTVFSSPCVLMQLLKTLWNKHTILFPCILSIPLSPALFFFTSTLALFYIHVRVHLLILTWLSIEANVVHHRLVILTFMQEWTVVVVAGCSPFWKNLAFSSSSTFHFHVCNFHTLLCKFVQAEVGEG